MQKNCIVLFGILGMLFGCSKPVPEHPSPKGVFPALSDEFGKIISVTGTFVTFNEDTKSGPEYDITITTVEGKVLHKPIAVSCSPHWYVTKEIDVEQIAKNPKKVEYTAIGYEQVNMGGDPDGIHKVISDWHPDQCGGWCIKREFVIMRLGLKGQLPETAAEFRKEE
jgi:hypothetical protein